MNSDRLIKWAENKYNRLLILLFWLLVSIALPEKQAIAKVTILILFLVAMLLIIRQIRPGKWWLKFYTGLVLMNLTLLVLQVLGMLNISGWNHGQSAIEFILFIVLSFPIFLIQREIFVTKRVTADTLKGGIAIYVLLGLDWAIFYTILYHFNPSSFNGITQSQSQADFLHFSFITLTTVGYGDIHPLATSARIATDLEAIAGVMYPAILISRLVSLYNTNSQELL
jgi:hypothetical protein